MKTDFPSDEAYKHAAWFLMCEARALKAVATVEAGPYGGFNDDGTPVVLFERHKFDEHTKGRFRGTRLPGVKPEWADISLPKWGGWGPRSLQHPKLAFASTLDREAALKSASWGLFQIMGENHVAAGFPELQGFVNAMIRDVDSHLRALLMFIRNNPRILYGIRMKDWPIVARYYNGEKFRVNQWDTKMRDAYARLA